MCSVATCTVYIFGGTIVLLSTIISHLSVSILYNYWPMNSVYSSPRRDEGKDSYYKVHQDEKYGMSTVSPPDLPRLNIVYVVEID